MRLGLGAGYRDLETADAHASLATAVELGDSLALTAGVSAAVGPLWARAGLEWRPARFLEAGLDLSVPVTRSTSRSHTPNGEWPVVPTLTVRGFAAER